MRTLFWISAAAIAYTYLGYPLLLLVQAKLAPRPVKQGVVFPTVSIIVAVHNEASRISAKIDNLSQLDYPKDRYEVIFASEGSTDSTVKTLQSLATGQTSYVVLEEHRGKAAALALAARQAQGEIFVFTDVRQILVPEAIQRMVSLFADPQVGAVSGELLLGTPTASQPDGRGVGLYWQVEQYMRNWEGDSGSVVGVLGAFYGVRKSLYSPPPEGTILDDLFVALSVCRRGGRVVYDSRARVWDDINNDIGKEFHRKVRTLTGNYQLLQIAPWVLTPQNPILFRFGSHKLMRLLIPFWLIGVLLASSLLPGPLYRFAFGVQLAFYAMSGLAYFAPNLKIGSRLSNAALTFVMLNAAAVVAFVNFVTGKKEVWVR